MDNNWPATNIVHNSDKYLSAFGRKVLGVLLKQYGAEEFARSKDHLSQRRSEISNSIIAANNENLANLSYDLGTVPIGENSSTLPTAELLNSIQDTDITAINTNLNMVPNSSCVSNSQPVFSLNMHKNYSLTLSVPKNNEFLESKQITWENMLDCELLKVETSHNIENSQKIKKNIAGHEKEIFEISCKQKNQKNKHKYVVGIEPLVDTYKKEKANEKDIFCNLKVLDDGSVTKRQTGNRKNKSDCTDTLHVVPQKILKVRGKKLNILKGEYTKKAINSWLNNVDPTHLVDGLDIQSALTSAPNIVNQNPNDILHTSLEILEFQERPKKIVQSQLINDNGAMKFSKPNNNKGLSKKCDEENYMAIEMDKIKMKKCKFVAPIKSQNV